MKLRVLRKRIETVVPTASAILGLPIDQVIEHIEDTLQYFDKDKNEWIDVPIEEITNEDDNHPANYR